MQRRLAWQETLLESTGHMNWSDKSLEALQAQTERLNTANNSRPGSKFAPSYFVEEEADCESVNGN